MRGLSVTALAAVLLASCATQPVSNDEARHVASGSVLAPSLTRPSPGASAVTIKRDTGLSAGACSSRVFIDGRPVADLDPGEKVVVYLADGDHIFGARPNGICAGGTPELRTSVRQGARLTLRMGYGTWGDFYLSVSAF